MDCSSITDFQQSTAIRIAKKFRNLHIGKTNNNIDIVEMKKRLDEKYNFYSISFSQDVFPAIFIRPVLNRKRDYATILLFRNSKFIIIGSRSVQIMNNTLEVVKDLTC